MQKQYLTSRRKKTGKGKRKITGPYGHLRPVLCCPGWFPGTAKDRAKNRTYHTASKD